MPLPLRSAGNQIDESAGHLSSALVNVEQYAFAEIARHFTALQSEAMTAVIRSGNIYVTLDAALEASTITAHELLANATSLAVDATRRETSILGDALDEPEAARIASDMATEAVAAAVQLGLETFRGTLPFTRRAFANHLRTQILRARDQAEVQLRVFSPRPIAGIGLGVWYKPVGWLQAQARAVSMGAVNSIKATGIAALDERV